VFETAGITRKLLCPGFPYVISGGNDSLTKIWDIRDPQRSFCLGSSGSVCQRFKEINYGDLRIIQQSQSLGKRKNKGQKGDEEEEEVPLHRLMAHSDAVLDVEFIVEPRPLIVTGSRDGSIKVWN